MVCIIWNADDMYPRNHGSSQGCIQKFRQGGANLGYGQKRGGRRVEAQWYHVRCYTLGGARMTQGGRMPPHPPLNTALAAEIRLAIQML